MNIHIRWAVATALCGLATGCAGAGRPVATGLLPHRPAAQVVRLPGLEYRVLHSGPSTGSRPLRSDDVMIRYVGRLADHSIFSTSARDGAEPSRFPVRSVIPGFSALVQLMRPGDRWRFIIPAYLGYGYAGRRFTPPEATLRRDVPPDSTLIFDVELVSILPGR